MEETTIDWTDDTGLLSLSDAAAIGFKIVEMADRLVDVDLAMPGSQATFGFELDDRQFRITVTRIPTPPNTTT